MSEISINICITRVIAAKTKTRLFYLATDVPLFGARTVACLSPKRESNAFLHRRSAICNRDGCAPVISDSDCLDYSYFMTEDLAAYHQSLTGIFAPADSAEIFALSAAQLEFFHENGYLSGVKILDEDQVEILCGELKELMNPSSEKQKLFYEFHHNESEDPDRILFHALGAWRISRAFHDLLWNPLFTGPASQILGGRLRFWHDQLFVKPAKDGGIVAWHQDFSYWTRTKPMAHLTCWIALDDSTAENGCVRYVPRSHKWELLPRGDLAGDMNAIFDVLTEEQRKEFEPVAIELKKGEASFHHPLMLHGSYENSSEKPRRATVINVFRDGVVSDTDEPLLEGVPVVLKGSKIEGRFFPLLS